MQERCGDDEGRRHNCAMDEKERKKEDNEGHTNEERTAATAFRSRIPLFSLRNKRFVLARSTREYRGEKHQVDAKKKEREREREGANELKCEVQWITNFAHCCILWRSARREWS